MEQEDGVQDIVSRSVANDTFASPRWGGMEVALDGFPVAALLDEWLRAGDGEADGRRRAQHLVAHILAVWANTIEHDLERFPPATIEVLQIIRQRMVDARDALLRLLVLLDDMNNVASNHVTPDDALMARVSGSDCRVSDALRLHGEEVAQHGRLRQAVAGARWPAVAPSRAPAQHVAGARS
jgi:hypothetical protein